MIEKRFIEKKRMSEELLRLMAFFVLQLPRGINYELWRDLHLILGDFE